MSKRGKIGDIQGRLNYLEALDKILIRELERIESECGVGCSAACPVTADNGGNGCK